MQSSENARRPSRRDAAVVVAVALAARLAVVAWAWSRVPPSADGTFYDVIARRIAAGLGYTWLWPDGTVTYAAHYPVGYPAFMAIGYRLFGAAPGVAMLGNALVGAFLPWAVHRTVARFAPSRVALGAGLVAALHPALVLYTPALMTEGVTSALVAVAIAVAASPSPSRALQLGLGVVVGLATYFRPQCVVLAPLLPLAASLATRVGALRAASIALVASAAALAVVSPWTLRNCQVMDQCALVSVNGGWNLLIGTDPSAKGTWAELKVPDACRDVFDEAGKDACFGREARRVIAADPGAWAGLAPAKLSATFDFFGAGPGYLRGAAPDEFAESAKRAWLWAETVVQRLVLAAGLLALLRRLSAGWPARATWALGAAMLVLSALPHATPAYLVLGAVALVLPRLASGTSPAVPISGAVVLVTALVHAVFFGAGRYGLVLVAPTVVLGALLFVPGSGWSFGRRDGRRQGF
jgi:4-amino-4-deoxy-L-arabinose transferase-like glycosyltransferase